MSTHSNPFVQGGWYGQSQFSLGPDGTSNPQSAYGALPLGIPNNGVGHTLYQFTQPNPTILNSIVVSAADQRPRWKLTTDHSLAGYTTFKDADGKGVALIEWNPLPKVEIRGSLAKMPASEWLRVAMDSRFGRSVRQMDIRGARFVWCPNGDFIHLFTQTPESSPCVTVAKRRSVVDISFTPQAISWGLVEPCIVAVALLLSGRRLE
ncbi:hypothetical protein SCHPADRAFT_678865 [Schizopora paradoxa]|uniref:DUF6593 domain-containing protein n=1 Tax=Schizopora paradoxa TaxID=27342 RepID=A0A0H2RPL6_9AGAM|nr:hypothetical protein SCHPADRAFT_678865 [Schizopora paradoxa]